MKRKQISVKNDPRVLAAQDMVKKLRKGSVVESKSIAALGVVLNQAVVDAVEAQEVVEAKKTLPLCVKFQWNSGHCDLMVEFHGQGASDKTIRVVEYQKLSSPEWTQSNEYVLDDSCFIWDHIEALRLSCGNGINFQQLKPRACFGYARDTKTIAKFIFEYESAVDGEYDVYLKMLGKIKA